MKNLLSHPADRNNTEKSLFEHLFNVARASQEKISEIQLNLSLIDKDDLEKLVFVIGLFHDFGKATAFFQNYIRLDNTQKKSFSFQKEKRHSTLSSIVAFHVIQDNFSSDLWSYLAFQVINRHHGNLIDFDLALKDYKINIRLLKKQVKNILNFSYRILYPFYKKHGFDIAFIKNISFLQFQDFLDDTAFFVEDRIENKKDRIEYFLINNLIFSLLIDNDKADASRINEDDYFEGNLKEELYDVNAYLKFCRDKEPDKFNPKKKINNVRNQFLEDIQNNPDISSKNHFYKMTAPTGIGKTLGCMAFSKILREKIPNKARIIYCLPYTSIIDQNHKVFADLIEKHLQNKFRNKPNRYLIKHHYLSEQKIKNRIPVEERRYSDYLDDKLLIESWRSALVVTTFVQLFHSIFSNRNRNLKKFHNITNSIVILDEVQNVDPNYYLMINKVFKILAKRFNTYFLLMTATQPKILDEKETIDIIRPNKFMTNPVFNRVKIKPQLDISKVEQFEKYFINNFSGKNALLVFNTKKMAVDCFNFIRKQLLDYECYCLTNYLIPKDKLKQINEIDEKLKAGKKIIVVSTQLIEAGVDLSFENVYRDLAPFDSIVQVAGRCNRSNEYGDQNGKMTLLNFDNTGIYNKNLIQFSEKVLSGLKRINSKDLYRLSKKYYDKFNFKKESTKILNSIYNLNYTTKRKNEEPICDFNLIEENYKTSLFVFPNENDQKIMDEFIDLKTKIETGGYQNNDEKSDILIRLETLKQELKQYQISLYPNELNEYEKYLQPEDKITNDINYPYKYISYENIKYNSKTGFQNKSMEEQIDEMFY